MLDEVRAESFPAKFTKVDLCVFRDVLSWKSSDFAASSPPSSIWCLVFWCFGVWCFGVLVLHQKDDGLREAYSSTNSTRTATIL